MGERPETVLQVLEAGAAWLERRGIDAPRRSMELLLGHVLGLDRLRLYLAHDRPLSREERDRLRGLVARRGADEPVAYLLGSWEFHGHELEVGPEVLVPRPETEGLVDHVLARLRPGPARVIDLGTGSGAIAIAIALARPDVVVVGVDLSEAALAVAARNVERHRLGERIVLRQGSWWEALPPGEPPFDLLVSNPPYVDPAHPELVAPDVAAFEPGLALWTPPGEPAASYAAIARHAAEHLVDDAWLCFEIGADAADAVAAAVAAAPKLAVAEIAKDLEGRPRYLLARVAR